MDPLPNLLTTLTSSDALYDVLSYYTTCKGTNPLAVYLNQSEAAIVDLKNVVETYYLPSPLCEGSYAALNASIAAMNSVEGIYSDIFGEIVCVPLYNQLTSVLETGLCTQVFNGFFAIWISEYSSNTSTQ
jgi:hypothetical protein